MKKILFIVTHSEYGGAQRFIFSVAPKLAKDGYAITVAYGEPNNINTFLKDELTKKGIETIQLKHLFRAVKPLRDLKAVREIQHLIKSEQPDTLFLASSKAGFVGSMANRFIGSRKVSNVVYRIGGWSFNDPVSIRSRKFRIFAERFSASWKDTIVVNSKKDFADAKRLGIKPKNGIVLIHNGIDVYNDKILSNEKARKEISKLAGQSVTGKVVGTIANFYETKGLTYLIEGVKLLNQENVKFVIMGDGPLREELELQIQNAGLKDYVFLVGQVPNAHRYLKAFDIYLLPSVKEGFPWAVLEALAASIPVIATSVGAIPEILQNDQNGVVIEPKKPGQIAQAISKLLNNDHLRKEFGIKGNQTVLHNFSATEMLRKVERLL